MFGEHKKYLRWLFPMISSFLCFTAGPIWILSTYNASGWHSKFVAVPVFAFICLMAVTASANYKKNQRLINFHYTCAILTAACFLIWLNVVAFKLAYIGIAILLVMLYAGIRTKTLKKCSLFWLETAGYYSLLFILLVIELIPIRV